MSGHDSEKKISTEATSPPEDREKDIASLIDAVLENMNLIAAMTQSEITEVMDSGDVLGKLTSISSLEATVSKRMAKINTAYVTMQSACDSVTKEKKKILCI